MKNFNSVADRLQFLCDHYKMKRADLTRLLEGDISRATVGNIINGRNKPSTKFWDSFTKHMPQINVAWLLTGKGKMFNPIPGDTPVMQDDSHPLLPVYPSNITANVLHETDAKYPGYHAPTSSDCDFMIYAPTSAMSPTIKRGELLFCAQAELDDLFNYTKICLIAIGDKLVLRRLEKIDGGYRLVASHSNYDAVDIKAEAIGAVYYVNEVLRTL